MLGKAILFGLTLCAAPAAWAQEGSVAFFGITFLDSSLQTAELGADPAEAARIDMLEALVTERFEAEGYTLVDLTPVADDRARIINPAKCYGCDTRMAAKLGADYSLVGEVQKVSNLILTMNLQMRDATSGDMVRGRVVDIRSNTDDSWRRGMAYILKTAFFREEEE